MSESKIQLVLIVCFFCLKKFNVAQQNQILLDQGPLVGLKIFPDSSRTAVYAFLGIPYAEPPVDKLRFAPPKIHRGWNSTWQAIKMRPICPQLFNTIYDETADGKIAHETLMDENCLYLNIWVSENGIRFGNLPVLVIITGEEMSYDWPHNRITGLDFATEGIVVVSVQYRNNIFGWFNLGQYNKEMQGNYGFLDQKLALEWIQNNIKSFGGNSRQITLLGHGSGAQLAMAHLLTTDLNDRPFNKLILMSPGNIEKALNIELQQLQNTSQLLIKKLGCQFEEHKTQIVRCLRSKSVGDLRNAFESIYEYGNDTYSLGPILDSRLKLHDYFKNDTFVKNLPPTIMGITSNEGAFLQDYWVDLAREGYQTLRSYVNQTLLPHILRELSIKLTDNHPIINALNWRYFSGENAVSVAHLLKEFQKLISEAFYEAPFYSILENLSTNSNYSGSTILYAYIFDLANSMDMRGKVNLFGGASHSSDLPLLLGPSLFQQISRRRFTPNEDKLCRKIRNVFANFIKTGNPTPGRAQDAWLPYGTNMRKFIYSFDQEQVVDRDDIVFGNGIVTGADVGVVVSSTAIFEQNLPQIERLLHTSEKTTNDVGLSRTNRNYYRNNNNNDINLAQENLDNRRINVASFTPTNENQRNSLQDSGYAKHLKRVYSFWQVLLPNMSVYRNGGDDYNNEFGFSNNDFTNNIRLLEASANAQRYRQGFYALLTLVCLLLGILCLCVYLLRRESDAIGFTSTQSTMCCL